MFSRLENSRLITTSSILTYFNKILKQILCYAHPFVKLKVFSSDLRNEQPRLSENLSIAYFLARFGVKHES